MVRTLLYNLRLINFLPVKAPLLLSIFVAVLPNAVYARAADGRPVRNSFIDRPVGEISDLIAHVKADRVVADRYERHFAMDRTTLLRFLDGLHRGRLQQDGVYTIYSVPQGGRLKMHLGRIRRGEAMFFNRSGQPTLVAKCGNPVALGPSRAQKANPAAVVPGESQEARTMELDIARLADAMEEPTVALEPSLPATESAMANAAPASFAGDVVPVTATGLGAGSFLASFSFLTSLAAALPMQRTQPSKTAPVPEPASMVALAVGAASLRQRSRRRS